VGLLPSAKHYEFESLSQNPTLFCLLTSPFSQFFETATTCSLTLFRQLLFIHRALSEAPDLVQAAFGNG
jgi:hypothetical protein